MIVAPQKNCPNFGNARVITARKGSFPLTKAIYASTGSSPDKNTPLYARKTLLPLAPPHVIGQIMQDASKCMEKSAAPMINNDARDISFCSIDILPSPSGMLLKNTFCAMPNDREIDRTQCGACQAQK